MKMERMMIQLPKGLKQKLDGLRAQGYTASGYIRAVLVREFNEKEESHHGRKTT